MTHRVEVTEGKKPQIFVHAGGAYPLAYDGISAARQTLRESIGDRMLVSLENAVDDAACDLRDEWGMSLEDAIRLTRLAAKEIL